MFEKVEDIKGPLVVGEHYWVKCIRTKMWGNNEHSWLPIFGEPHYDDYDTGAPPDVVDRLHVHCDMRFMTNYQLIGMDFDEQTQGAILLFSPDHSALKRGDLPKGQISFKEQKYFHLECLRPWMNFDPSDSARRRRFEGRYSKHTIDLQAPVCPHQGFDLSCVKPRRINGKDVLICPGHVLGWCANTGKLVPRHD